MNIKQKTVAAIYFPVVVTFPLFGWLIAKTEDKGKPAEMYALAIIAVIAVSLVAIILLILLRDRNKNTN